MKWTDALFVTRMTVKIKKEYEMEHMEEVTFGKDFFPPS